ncbi:MAG: Uma2 family endonuclease [Sandaracinaceae bacterium]|nr:Uma2 family endonuclease [Sandaracinaceae bacterium]
MFVEMSPESIDSHNKVKVEVSAVLHRLARELDLGEVYADGALLTNEAAGLSTEPDALFATWETLASGRLASVSRKNREDDAIELVGTPDLVVEVVSDSSVRKDLVALRERYARAGVPEYWLIDARGERLSFQVLLLRAGAYEAAAPDGEAQPSAVFPRRFSLHRAKNRVGTWTYTLEAT